MKLSSIQLWTLEQAALVENSPHVYDDKWFCPSHHETADVYSTKATCKALCGKGLLEYRVAHEAINRLPAILQFRITQAGIDYLKRTQAAA